MKKYLAIREGFDPHAFDVEALRLERVEQLLNGPPSPIEIDDGPGLGGIADGPGRQQPPVYGRRRG